MFEERNLRLELLVLCRKSSTGGPPEEVEAQIVLPEDFFARWLLVLAHFLVGQALWHTFTCVKTVYIIKREEKGDVASQYIFRCRRPEF